ncbi:glutathione S-transferase A4-like [Amphiura filiformis]|uniref:glutathione S-transferase A4-like n=1 Tax=Amphiura filiformis TaxID=82378 RepID=UPI003B226C38
MAARLYSTNGRGLSEVVRIALGAAEIPFEESFIETKDDLAKLRAEGKELSGQNPLLEIDGLKLVESMDILRHICNKQGWLGTNPEEKAKIEKLSDEAHDMYTTILYAYLDKVSKNKDKEWEAVVQKVKDRFLPVFEKELESNGSGYLVGGSLSMCDIVFLDSITWLAENAMEVLVEYPNTLNFLMTMSSHPAIQKYLDGPQRKPLPDVDYIKTVNAIYSL